MWFKSSNSYAITSDILSIQGLKSSIGSLFYITLERWSQARGASLPEVRQMIPTLADLTSG